MDVAGIAHLDARARAYAHTHTHTHTHTQYLLNYIGHQRLKKEEIRQTRYFHEQRDAFV